MSYYARATDNNAVAGPAARHQRHVFPPHPSVQQGLQAGDVDGWRRGRWRRRDGSGRRALAAATADRRRHVQHAARPQADGGRQVPRGHDRAHAVAEPPARAGRRAGRAHEQPAGRARSRVPEDRGTAAAGRRVDENGRRQAPGPEPGRCAAARAAGAAAAAAGRGGVRAAGADPAQCRRRRRRRRGLDCRGSGGPVPDGTGSHGEPVRDQPARQPAGRRSADRRARGEAEGAGTAAGAGAGTPAAHGRRSGAARQRQRPAARPGRAGRGGGPAAGAAVTGSEPTGPGQHGPAAARRRRCDASGREQR